MDAFHFQLQRLLKLKHCSERLRRLAHPLLPLLKFRVSPLKPGEILLPFAYVSKKLRQIPFVDSGISARSGTVEDICKRPTSNVQRPTLNSEQATACAYSNALLLQQDGARSISAQLPLALSPAEFCARAMRRTD